jgi:hypothetical protein
MNRKRDEAVGRGQEAASEARILNDISALKVCHILCHEILKFIYPACRPRAKL